MTQQEYMDWWCALPEDYATLDEPVRTLVEHVEVLLDRIGQLPEGLNCCCGYDHPADVCMPHAAALAARQQNAEETA